MKKIKQMYLDEVVGDGNVVFDYRTPEIRNFNENEYISEIRKIIKKYIPNAEVQFIEQDSITLREQIHGVDSENALYNIVYDIQTLDLAEPRFYLTEDENEKDQEDDE